MAAFGCGHPAAELSAISRQFLDQRRPASSGFLYLRKRTYGHDNRAQLPR